jgi:hypothetical protein
MNESSANTTYITNVSNSFFKKHLYTDKIFIFKLVYLVDKELPFSVLYKMILGKTISVRWAITGIEIKYAIWKVYNQQVIKKLINSFIYMNQLAMDQNLEN